MEAERPSHTTVNFCRQHDFRTERTVLSHTHTHTHTHTQRD